MTQPPDQGAGGAGATALDWADPTDLPVEEVREVFLTLSKALRAYQLYDPNNPVYKRFVANLRQAFQTVWESRDQFQILVEEDRLTWMGEEVYRNESRSDSLAFVFHRDGVRDLTFHKGMEGDELERFLDAIHRGRNARGDGDDLLTILWDLDLELLEYGSVDLAQDGAVLPTPSGELPPLDARGVVQAEVGEEAFEGRDGEEEEDEGEGEEGGGTDSPAMVSKEDFNPTLYALEDSERAYLRDELEKEMDRDLRADVLNALLDRLEEPDHPDRQEEILGILRTLLPNFLSQGALRSAARMVEELTEIREQPGVFNPALDALVERTLDDLSSEEAVSELVRSIEDGTFPPDGAEVGLLLRCLRGGALAPLLRGLEQSTSNEAKRVLGEAAAAIGDANRNALVRLLSDPDSQVVVGCVRLVGRLGLTEAGSSLARLLEEGDPEVRRAVVAAAEEAPSSVLGGALLRLLSEGEDPRLRMKAARVLGRTGYAPAAPVLRELLESRELKSTDLSEKIAFYEAYAQVAGSEAVPYLDKLLNGKGFLGRREPSDVRACAALGLGKVEGAEAAAARAVLEKAKGEDDPVVRSAVNRALRGEEGRADG